MSRTLLLAPFFILSLSACVYNQHSQERSAGVVVSQQQLTGVEIGKTTRQVLLTQWGIPDRTQQEKDGLEIFEYINERSTKSNKSFIFLFNIDSDKVVSRKVTRVAIRDGVVASVNTSET